MNEKALEIMTTWFPKLQEIVKEDRVVVAGGAARDMFLSKPIKDVDFVMSVTRDSLKPPLKTMREVERHLTEYGFLAASKDPDSDQYGSGFIVWKHAKVPIDVILTTYDDPLEFIKNTFDVGLCMIALTHEGHFLYNDRFEFDLNYKMLTGYIHDGLQQNQVGRCFHEHIPRLLEKYPDHRPSVRYMPFQALAAPNWELTYHE